MKKKIITMLLCAALVYSYYMPVYAAEADNTEQAADTENDDNAGAEDTDRLEGDNADADGGAEAGNVMEGESANGAEASNAIADGERADGTAADGEGSGGIVIPKGNMVNVDMIDLSLHSETSGDFTPVYAYKNPFQGKDTSQGAIIEFYANPTWDVHILGTIFAINGSGAYDGKLYFTPGSYLGYNSAGFGGFYDANLFNYNIVTDYIKDGALIRIELLPNGFAVYANDTLCYDQTILNNPEAADGDFTADSDFSPVLTWLSGAEALYFGYGSWWNTVSDTANIELSRISFRLPDGTVLMDQLQADKDLVESLGGSVAAAAVEAQTELKLADVEVAVFDIHSVEYQGKSVLPYMATAVIIVILGALVTVILVCRQRTYE